MNSLKSLLITGLIGMWGAAAYAGNPVPAKENEPGKPTKQTESWCEIRGLYEKVYDSEGNSVLVCRMVSDNFCYSLPCAFGMPIGNKPAQKATVPPGVNIPEGQNFIAYYENNQLRIVYVEQVNSSVTVENGIEKVSVTLPGNN